MLLDFPVEVEKGEWDMLIHNKNILTEESFVLNRNEKIPQTLDYNLRSEYADLHKTTFNYSSLTEIITGKTEVYKKNEYFIKKGQMNTKLGILRKGVLRGFVTDENGNEINLEFHKENDIISGNLVPNIPTAGNLQAMDDCIIDVVNFEYAMSIINEDNSLTKMFNETLGKVNSKIHSRLTSFISYNALERYQYFLKEYPNLINRVPNYYIANFLGITPTQLSRIRRDFVKKNGN